MNMSSNLWKIPQYKLPILGIFRAAPAALALLMLSACDKPPAPGGPGAGGPPGGFKVPVEVAAVEQRDWAVVAHSVGNLSADEQVTIRNLTAGYIKDIPGIEGSTVAANDPVALIDDEKLRYELQSASAKNEEAQSTLRRRQPLFNQKLITEAEIVDAQAAAAGAEAAWSMAKRNLTDTIVRAPMAGTLGRRYVSPGDYVSVGAKLFDLVKTDVLKLDFPLPGNLISKIKVGSNVRITTDSYAGREFTGVVDFIVPVMDESTRTVRLRARVDNRDGLLKPNLFVNVDIAVSTIKNALVIPEEAVIPSLGGNSVFVVEDGAAMRHDIKIIDRSPGKVATAEGFKAGDQIVTTGHQKLADHVPVMPLPPGGMAELMKQQMQQKGPPGAGAPPAAAVEKPEAPKATPPKLEIKKPVNEVVTPPVTAPIEEKSQEPKPKSQTTSKPEIQNSKLAFQDFEFCRSGFVWNLALDAWNLPAGAA
jgi:membrane fusion protein (multidrug efflux system)